MLRSPLHGGKSTTQETTRQLSCKAKYLGTSTIYIGTAGNPCKFGTKLYLFIQYLQVPIYLFTQVTHANVLKQTIAYCMSNTQFGRLLRQNGPLESLNLRRHIRPSEVHNVWLNLSVTKYFCVSLGTATPCIIGLVNALQPVAFVSYRSLFSITG